MKWLTAFPPHKVENDARNEILIIALGTASFITQSRINIAWNWIAKLLPDVRGQIYLL